MDSDSGVTSSSRMSLDLAAERAGLDGGADGDHLIRVDALVRFAVKGAPHGFLHGGHAGHAAHERHLVDVGELELGVVQRLLDRGDGALDQVVGELLQLGARQVHVEVLGAAGVGRHKRQVDLRLRGGGEPILAFSAASLRRWRPGSRCAGRCPGRA